jgi:hypothetical protein
MRIRKMNRNAVFTRGPKYCAFLLAASLLFGSCSVIDALLPGDSKGLGDPFEYPLTIQYERSGMYITGIVAPDSVVFWVMPLGADGEVIEDPENPDGPPLRYELIGTGGAGSVSAVVPFEEYAILAYIDSDGDGALELGESYEIYDDHSLRDGAFDRVLVDEPKTVDFVLDMLDNWQAVYIYSPREGDIVSGDFTALFGTLVKDNPNLRVYLNSNQIPFDFDEQNSLWYAPVNESQLQASNYLRVELYDQGGAFIDEDQVSFAYSNMP